MGLEHLRTIVRASSVAFILPSAERLSAPRSPNPGKKLFEPAMLLRIFRLRSRRAVAWVVASVSLPVLLLCLAWATPAILGSRLAWPRVLAYLTSDFDGQVSSRSASLGWFSPVVIQGIHVEDRQGKNLAQIEEVCTEFSLLSLLFDPQRLGVIVLDQPALTVVCRDDGSNVEDVLAAWLAKSSSSDVRCDSIEIRNGSVDVVDISQSRIARLESMNAKIELPAATGSPGIVALDRSRVTVGSQAGTCAARVEWQGEAPAADLADVGAGPDVGVVLCSSDGAAVR